MLCVGVGALCVGALMCARGNIACSWHGAAHAAADRARAGTANKGCC
jgi:hypothetical protein